MRKTKKPIFFIILMLVSVMMISGIASAKTVKISGKNFAVDYMTFNGVTVSALYDEDNTSTHLCNELIYRFYLAVYGVEVYYTNNGSVPAASRGYFERTSEPQVGDVVMIFYKNASWKHVAIVKYVASSYVTLFEQADREGNVAYVEETLSRTNTSEYSVAFYHYVPDNAAGASSTYTGWYDIGAQRYYYVNGVKVTGWQYIDGAYYCFDTNGSMFKKSIFKWGDYYYAVDSNGRCVTGWVYDTYGCYMYFDPATGARLYGWQYIDGYWYYLDPDKRGYRKTNEAFTVNGANYYANADGTLYTGWKTLTTTKYYDPYTGAMVTGWKKIDGSWYLFDQSGNCVKGRWCGYDGNMYYLNNSGQLETGWLTVKGYVYYSDPYYGYRLTGWQVIGGKYYYLDPNNSGKLVVGWINPGNGYYYLDQSDGHVCTGWLTLNGYQYFLDRTTALMAVGWKKIDGYWYYFDNSGALHTGWLKYNGSWYYMNPATGLAVTGTFVIDGVTYTFNSSGVCVG